MVSPLMQRSSPLPPVQSLVPASLKQAWSGQRPRWLSVAIAVLLCIAASGSGAFVVRALKIRRQPLSLQPTQLSPNPTVTPTATPPVVVQTAPPAPTQSTEVVDVGSLSIERRAPRAVVRVAPPAAAVTPSPAAKFLEADKNAENTGSDEATDPTATPAPSAKKSTADDLPAAAHSNPYPTGGADDAPAKKPAAPSDDAPGL
jgi:cytoskeletal protein RodZ